MLDSTYDVEINGIPYLIARTGVGDSPSYLSERAPLRALSSQLVQGERQGEFNLRPDIMEWRQSDWSGIPWRRKFNPELPGDVRSTTNADVSTPGFARVSEYWGSYGISVVEDTVEDSVYDPNFPGAADAQGIPALDVKGFAIDEVGKTWWGKADTVAVRNPDGTSSLSLEGQRNHPVFIHDTAIGTSGQRLCVTSNGRLWYERLSRANHSVAKAGDIRETFSFTNEDGEVEEDDAPISSVKLQARINRQDNLRDDVVEGNGFWNLATTGNNKAYMLWNSASYSPFPGSLTLFEVDLTRANVNHTTIFDRNNVTERTGFAQNVNPLSSVLTSSDNEVFAAENRFGGATIIRCSEGESGLVARDWAYLTGMFAESILYHGGFVYVMGCDFNSARLRLVRVSLAGQIDTIGILAEPDYGFVSMGAGRFVKGGSHAEVWMVAHVLEDGARTYWDLWRYDLLSGSLSRYGQFSGMARRRAVVGGNAPVDYFWRLNSAVRLGRGVVCSGYEWVIREGYPRVVTPPGASLSTQEWGDFEIQSTDNFRVLSIDLPPAVGDKASWGVLVSGEHDYNTSAEKVALGVEVTPIVPAKVRPGENFQARLYLFFDGEQYRWAGGGEYHTFNGPPYYVELPEGPQFRTAQMRLDIKGNTDGDWAVEGMSLFATVVRGVREWQLSLDCSDEVGAGARLGSEQLQNLRVLQEQRSVVSFKDGYHSRESGVFTEHDVVIDGVFEVLSQPGEGLVQVSLREVKEL